VRYVWLTIIAVSAIPLLPFALYANPLSLILLGVEEWRKRVSRLYPYRRWFWLSLVVCTFSVVVYSIRYG
jgi:hypothetical protein